MNKVQNFPAEEVSFQPDLEADGLLVTPAGAGYPCSYVSAECRDGVGVERALC